MSEMFTKRDINDLWGLYKKVKLRNGKKVTAKYRNALQFQVQRE